MQFFEKLSQLWNLLCAKVKPFLYKAKAFWEKVWKVLKDIWRYMVKLRKIFLAIPVAWTAIVLAISNLARLPELVGLNLQADGSFAIQMGRLPAVLIPILITLVCLLLMFISKRTLTPWLVSVFSLAVPLMIWIINVFPA